MFQYCSFTDPYKYFSKDQEYFYYYDFSKEYVLIFFCYLIVQVEIAASKPYLHLPVTSF